MPSLRNERAAVSLVDELAEIETLLESAEMVADLLGNEGLSDERSAQRAPMMLATIIDFALNRVRLLRRVVRLELDPRFIASKRNSRPAKIERWEDPDILLGRPGRKRTGRLPTK